MKPLNQADRRIRTHQIIYQGFSLLTANREVFIDPNIRATAARYNATRAQLIFRFSMQVGILPLTGTTNPLHMQEDVQSERFMLLGEEIRQIETIGL